MNENRYEQYLINHSPTEQELDQQRQTRFSDAPLISVICPSRVRLDEQTYLNFEQAQADNAKGDYLLFLPKGAKLRADAMYRFAVAAAEGADCVYCDDDEGGRNPLFKPDYAPQTLKSYNYIGGALMVHRELYAQGGCQLKTEHDFALGMTQKAGKVTHLPYVLVSAKREPLQIFPWRPKLKEGLVSVIICNRAGYEPLKNTLVGIEQVSIYENYECVVVDAAPYDARLDRLYRNLEQNKAARTVHGVADKNIAALFNQGAEQAKGKYLLFLMAGTVPISADFMERMMEMTEEKDVAVVGAKLLNDDGTLNSCGIVVGLHGGLFSLYENLSDKPKDDNFRRIVQSARNVSALRLDGLFMKKRVFVENAGFDATLSAVGFAEEFCLRVAKRRMNIVYLPAVSFTVKKPVEMPVIDTQNSQRLMDSFRPMLTHGDPQFNPNLDYDCNSIQVAAESVSPLILHQKNGWWV